MTTDPVLTAALDAIAARDWARLRPLLHPYLQWSKPGSAIRGRTTVLAHLETSPDLGVPASYELRDGQIYRLTFR